MSNGLPMYGDRQRTTTSESANTGRLTDMEIGYKAFRTELVKGLELAADRFDIEPGVTAKLLCRGIDIFEVPISYQPRSRQQSKKIGMRDGH